MRKRALLIVVGLILPVLALGAGLWLIIPPPGVTRVNFERLRPGMTREQVKALFGEPGHPFHPRDEAVRRYSWTGPDGMFLLEFDAAEDTFFHGYVLVEDTVVRSSDGGPVSPIDRLRRWLGF